MSKPPDVALQQAETLLDEAVTSFNLGAAKARAADELIEDARRAKAHAEGIKQQLHAAHLDARMACSGGESARDQAHSASTRIPTVRPLP